MIRKRSGKCRKLREGMTVLPNAPGNGHTTGEFDPERCRITRRGPLARPKHRTFPSSVSMETLSGGAREFCRAFRHSARGPREFRHEFRHAAPGVGKFRHAFRYVGA